MVIFPQSGHEGDTRCWNEWTKQIFTAGLGNVYKFGTDYLPLYHYILWLFGKFQGSTALIEQNIYYLKIITLLFDFLTGFYLIKLLYAKFTDLNQSVFYSLLFFLNIAYFYNTLIWGQVDGILACLIFLAFFYSIKSNVLVALIFIVLSLNFKLQSIIFLPLLGLLLLRSMVKNFSFKKLLVWLAVPVTLQLLILTPFIITGDLERVWNVVTGSVGKYPVVSMNAHNFWSLALKGNLMEIQDNTRLFGITYKSWGLFLFFSTSLLTLWPLLRNTITTICFDGETETQLTIDKTLLIAALVPMLFFFLNTQMHERYLHPAMIFLAAYSLISKEYFPYVLGSIAYFLNLEGVLRYLQLRNYDILIFHSGFIAGLFFVCIGYLFLKLYKIIPDNVLHNKC